MRSIKVLKLAAFATMLPLLVAQAPGVNAETKSGFDHQLKGYSAQPLDTLEWFNIAPGIEVALLWGDPENGPSGQMVRFAKSLAVPAFSHKHTYGYHAVVISGASKHWVKGESEADAKVQGPGDYWFQEGGQFHTDYFLSDEPTVLYIVWEGPADTVDDGE